MSKGTTPIGHILLLVLTGGLLLSGFPGCKEARDRSSDNKKPFTVTCTTSMIRDAAEHIAGDKARVIPIMGAGVDPHVYRSTQGDLQKLRKADLVFYNGLHLEGKMVGILEKLGRKKPVIPIASALQKGSLMASEDYPDAHDPHIWFDVKLWKKALERMAKALQKHDTTNASFYKRNARAYFERLDSLDRWVKANIERIPEEKRVLITAHDAFSYFGRAYDIEVRGLQGLSTTTEYGLRDIRNMVDFITKRNIPAVFIESSVPSRPMNAVIKGCKKRGQKVVLGGTLYSDALGEKHKPQGTYLGMVRHNVNTIVKNLSEQDSGSSTKKRTP